MPHTAKHKPATGHEIKQVLGPQADAELVTQLQQTGASLDEIAQARTWLDDDDYIGGDLQRTMPARVREVCELLLEEEDYDGHEE